jgi:hypothetical protein
MLTRSLLTLLCILFLGFTLTGPIGDLPQREPATEKRAGPPESF